MQLREVTVKRLSTYFNKYEKPCCSYAVTVIFLLQMEQSQHIKHYQLVFTDQIAVHMLFQNLDEQKQK